MQWASYHPGNKQIHTGHFLHLRIQIEDTSHTQKPAAKEFGCQPRHI